MVIENPLVFMSHSSSDQLSLSRLRDALVETTGGAIEFFLSSVTLGKNWPREVESALKRANLMLCFVSPMALNSQWLFFEAGYAYRHGIAVVPITIQDIVISKLTPPLGLFQGIALTSHTELNSVIKLLNESFGHHHRAAFTADHYQRIFGSMLLTTGIPSGKYRVFRQENNLEVAYEELLMAIDHDRVTIHSPEWESNGRIANGRCVARFKYFRGSTSNDTGTHDMTWNGREFAGTCCFDNGDWGTTDLVWRPFKA